jgi:hypothetical protein
MFVVFINLQNITGRLRLKSNVNKKESDGTTKCNEQNEHAIFFKKIMNLRPNFLGGLGCLGSDPGPGLYLNPYSHFYNLVGIILTSRIARLLKEKISLAVW